MPLSKNKGYDGSDWRNIKVDSNGRLLIDVNSQTEKDRHSYVYDGIDWLELRRPDIFKAISETSFDDDDSLTIWTPASGKVINLMGFCISAFSRSSGSWAVNFELYDNATHFMSVGILYDFSPINLPNNGLKFSAIDNALIIKNIASATVIISASAWGFET